MKKRLIAMGLAAMMLIGIFSGCGKTKKPDKEQTNSVTSAKYAYKPSYTQLTAGDSGLKMTYVGKMAVLGDRAYYIGSCEMGEEEAVNEITGEPILDEDGNPFMNPVSEAVLFSANLTDGKVQRIEAYQQTPVPEGWNGDCYPEELTACEDGSLWICENQYFYYFELPEDFDQEKDDAYKYQKEEQRTVCKQILPDGTAGKEITLERGENPIYQTKILSDGSIYGTDWSNLYRFDENGKISKSIPMEGIDVLLELPNHQLAVTIWGENGSELRVLNQKTMTFGEPQKLPTRANRVMDGTGDYDYLYQTGSDIYGNTLTGQPEKLLSWMDSDVDPGMLSGEVKATADGKIHALNNGDMGAVELITMTPVNPSTLPERQILTMACMFVPWDVRSQVVKFNKSQDQVRILMKNYSEFGTEENPQGGIQKLNTEVVSGVIPDLFYLNSEIPVEVYGAKDFLMDLWPMIDADKELSRDDLMVHFFDTLSQDGKLYEITDRFAISTAVGLSDVVGTADAWNLQELMNAYQTLGKEATIFGEMDTKAGILGACINRNLNAFIDWQKKECHFDTQEFADLLEFVNTFPAEFDDEDFDWNTYQNDETRVMARKQLLSMEYLTSFDRVLVMDAALKGKANYIGYPTTGNNGSTFGYSSSFAIGAQCKNPEAAWSFVRQYLMEDHYKQNGADRVYPMETAVTEMEAGTDNQCRYNIWSFPTNKKVFDEIVKYYMTESYYTDPVTGEKEIEPKTYYWPDNSEEGIPVNVLSQSAYDSFMDLYNRTETVSAYNQEVSDIIAQECKAFFAGQKSAQETAKIIQDRVSLYVLEQA